MIVAVCSLKGGVGKTTLAVALAEAGAKRFGKALLVDTDPQASAIRHAELSEEAGAPLSCITVAVRGTDLGRHLSGIGASGYQLAVVDTPPGQLPVARAAIAAADVVLVPTRPAPADIDRAWTTLDMIEEAGTRAVVVLSQARTGTRALTASLDALTAGGATVARTVIPQREAIAISYGRPVGEPLATLAADLLTDVMGEQ
jgi:chromosome partitioning protein